MINMLLSNVFYFSLGMWIAGREKALPRWMGLSSGLFAVVMLAIKIVLAADGEGMFPSWANTILNLNLILFFWTIIPTLKWPTCLTSNAFPIYLLHWPLLCIYAVIVPNTVALGNGFGMFAKGMEGICGSLAVAVMMRKLLPGLSKYAFGGR